MRNTEATFLELVDHIGPEPTHTQTTRSDGLVVIAENERVGDPAPLTSQSIPIPVPVMIDGELVMDHQHVRIEQSEDECARDWAKAEVKDDAVLASARIIPGTRVVETTAPPVVSFLLDTGHYRRCDPPASLHVTRGRAAAAKKGE